MNFLILFYTKFILMSTDFLLYIPDTFTPNAKKRKKNRSGFSSAFTLK